ncbi:hypothetical protein [Halobacterium salinarum]|uniref:hypothetical protein n=1 Tax=Halobacterium salinarum TaxID=2242 RepID=UPI0025564964|nr:hypothetical protein [Halobacterium salinarum]MDL0133230.1 hypothetical protein [Halobacterium salinarum]
MKRPPFERFRQPEYTGENRCTPCTVLNLIIAAILGSAIARKSRLGGVIAVGISVGLIYLRGYLLPGTPTLTKRYLPPAVLHWFGKEPDPAVSTGFQGSGTSTQPASKADARLPAEDVSPTDREPSGAPNASAAEADPSTGDLEKFFVAHDILEPCADADDLCVTAEFEDAWMTAAERLMDADLTGELVAESFGMDTEAGEEFERIEDGGTQILESESGWIGQWPSRAALIADVAASQTLRSWAPEWSGVDAEDRGTVLNGLRMFIETCPTTGGDVELGSEVVESCCSSHEVLAVTCEDTGERLFEQQLPNAEA